MHFLDQAKIFVRSGAGGPEALMRMERLYIFIRSTGCLLALTSILFSTACAKTPTGTKCPSVIRLQKSDRWPTVDPQSITLTLDLVSVGSGAEIRWNGKAIPLTQLESYMGIAKTMTPPPFTLLHVAETADCETIQHVGEIIERTGYGSDGRGPYGLAPEGES